MNITVPTGIEIFTWLAITTCYHNMGMAKS